ncbi:MAG: hypothetical protein ACQKBY_06020 [Verrucomicrobiales bacterium]
MTLIPTTTQLDRDDARMTELIESVCEVTALRVQILDESWRWFWALPLDRLLALLNKDPARTAAIFENNTRCGTQDNATLDAANILDENGDPKFPKRAPVEMGRKDIVFVGGQFVHLWALDVATQLAVLNSGEADFTGLDASGQSVEFNEQTGLWVEVPAL